MFRRRSWMCLGFFLFLALAGSVFAQPITVDGITDHAVYLTTSLSYRVPTLAGFSYFVLLDGKPVPAGVTNRVTEPDFHELFIARTNATTAAVSTLTVRFVIESVNRNTTLDGPEKGLIEWTPYPQIPSTGAEFAGAGLYLMMPDSYPADLDLPVIARVQDAAGRERRANGTVTAPGFPSFRILRGHGSGLLPPTVAGSSITYNAQLASIAAYKEVNIDLATTWTLVAGTLSGNIVWPEDSRMYITGDVTIPAGSSLTIGAGSVVKINAQRNVNNRGSLIINGTTDRPVVFTATNRVVAPEVFTYAWGGIVMDDRTGNHPRLVANGAIFVGGGGNSGFSFPPGTESHKSAQPVLLCSSNSTAALTNCAIINSAGQAANGYFADITYDHCLLQKAITGGEYSRGTIILNHSAVIEFPGDDAVINPAVADGDYDAIYFTFGTHLVYDSLIGFAKDDAIDSGSNGQGTVLVTNCWIESALHEANAWSGGNRVAQTYDSVLMNCGQGFECGWSQTANSPLCYAGNVLSIGNSVGVRFGDNYDSISAGLLGFLRYTNSYALYNYRDVWGMTFRNTDGWYYRSNQMDIRDNFLTQPNPFHPTNIIWNPGRDGWRLSRFMTTPADAPVGIGFATWTNQFAMPALFNGVPVRLSSFTTNSVSVDYAFESGTSTLQTGTLTFEAGETVKNIYPAGFKLEDYAQVRVVLRNPVRGELTGQTEVNFQGIVAPPRISAAVPATQLDRARLPESFFVGLTSPSAQPVTVDYIFDTPAKTLASGTITFAPRELFAWAPSPGGDPASTDVVRLRLMNPSASLFGLTTIYYVKAIITPLPPPTPFISRGAVWKYPNVAGQQAASWNTLGFNDSTWQSGPTELGFGDGDEAQTISQFSGQITYYFRKLFTVTDPNAFTNLSMWMRRDDGGVVYLNGTEVFRSPNLPASPATITFTTLAADQGDNYEERATLSRAALVPGNNVAAVEMHQQSATSSDISFNFELIGNPVPPPPIAQPIYMATFDGQRRLFWGDPAFHLEQANSITGPWTIAATVSPFLFTPNPTVPQRFFRCRWP